MKPECIHRKQEGAILAVVMVLMIALSLITLSLFHVGNHSAREAVYEQRSSQAFWLAEAGRQVCIAKLKAAGRFGWNDIPETLMNSGAYQVSATDAQNTNFVSTGTVMFGGRPVTRRVQFGVRYAFPGYNFTVDSGGQGGHGELASTDWDFTLTGKQWSPGIDGPIDPGYDGGYHPGGSDAIVGMLGVNGNFILLNDSRVKNLGGSYNIKGDVNYTGTFTGDDSRIDGTLAQSSSFDYDPPNFADMNYESSADWNISALFRAENIDSGRLPQGKYVDENGVDLHGIVVKNQSPAGEHRDTDGDDYFFLPSGREYSDGRGTGGALGTGELKLGNDKTYYVDGHVWFHSDTMHHFEIDGQAVIVSSYDVHISEDLTYKNKGRDEQSDMLALVALGQDLNSDGRPGSYGDVFFGDPKYGYTAEVEGFLFANNNFHYNIDAHDPDNQDKLAEPKCGFTVFGNFMAMNQVVVNRDWYDTAPPTYQTGSGETRLAERYDPPGWWTSPYWRDAETGERIPASTTVTNSSGSARRAARWKDGIWEDVISGEELSSVQTASLRHYAMQVVYDDRIQDFASRLSGLPSGDGIAFLELNGWQEISP